MQENIGSQWDMIMNVLVDSGKYIDTKKFHFVDELTAVDFLQSTPSLCQSLSKWLSKLDENRKRSLDLTNEYRKKGNIVFDDADGENGLAADYYTKAIFSAPKDSVEIALAHANRAACCASNRTFLEEGYRDCGMALKFNYPEGKLQKLFERKEKLALLLDEKEKRGCGYPAETYQEMKNMKVELDELQKNLLDRHLANLNKGKNESKDAGKSSGPKDFSNKNLIEKSEPSVGRFIVAGQDIKKNQQIYKEKAFAFVPVDNDYHPDAISYHCQNCARTNCLPFPCYDCARASYCTPQCLKEHESVHKYECAGYKKNLWMKIGIAHLAFRNFVVGFPDAVERLVGGSKLTSQQLWSTLMSIDHKQFAYGDVLRLVTNFDKMEVNDFLRYALTAQMLAIYLDEYTDFFNNLSAKCLEIMDAGDWKKFVAALLMRHMGQLVSNGHAISDMELIPPSLYDDGYNYGSDQIPIHDLHLIMSSSRIFTAIFPKISMLNHSCDPNIRNTFDGPYLTIYAARDIAENEEVFNCYGPNYKLMSKAERQSALHAQYCFECKCDKCRGNDDTFKKYYEYICSNDKCRSPVDMGALDAQWWTKMHSADYADEIVPKFTCKKCKKQLFLNPESLDGFFEMWQSKLDRIGHFRSDEDTSALVNFYMNATKCLGKHHELKTKMAQIILSYKMFVTKKDLFPSLAYITMENFVTTRERFGQFSLEFIMATTYALNILEKAREIEKEDKSGKTALELEKIRKVLDVSKMEKSYIILPKTTQGIFRSAVKSLSISEKLRELALDDSVQRTYE